MKQKNVLLFTIFMIPITAIMLILLTMESILYYGSKINGIGFQIPMILQNIIGGFAFKPEIKIKDAYEFYNSNKDSLNIFDGFVTYAYGYAVFLANFCTLAWAYKILEKIFRITYIGAWFRRYKNHVIIFGYNDAVKRIIKSDSKIIKEEKLSVHLVCPDVLKADEKYSLRKNRIFIHNFDVCKAEDDDIKRCLKLIRAKSAGYIVLFDDSSMRNFTTLQSFCSKENRELISNNAKVYCRCEDRSIEELIEKYYDQNGFKKKDEQNKTKASLFDKNKKVWDRIKTKIMKKAGERKESNNEKVALFDLETFSIPELQVRKMFETKNLHWKESENRDVNVLIIGFGKLGQQALLQTMELAVFDSKNRINVDVIDYKMKSKAGIFANCLRVADFDFINDDAGNGFFAEVGIKPWTYRMSEKVADNPMTIHFIDMDVHDQTFRKLIDVGNSFAGKKDEKNMPYTYVVVAIDDSDVAIHCAREMAYSAHDCGVCKMPMMLRIDSDRQTRKYIKDQKENSSGDEDKQNKQNKQNKQDKQRKQDKQNLLENVDLIPSPEEVLTFDMLIKKELDKNAKLFNYYYSKINIGSNGNDNGSGNDNLDKKENDPEESREKWRNLSYYKRAANKALASYYELVFKNSVKDDTLTKYKVALEELFEFKKEEKGDFWIIKDKDAFAENLKHNELIYEHCKTEHRRWCYSFVARGWDYGKEKDEYWHKHNCLVTYEEMFKDEKTRNTLQYDAMKLMLYLKDKKII